MELEPEKFAYDEKSCGVVLFRIENGERHYLILKYPGGHFDFPKGHVEDHDKDEFDTARRELLEETEISDLKFFEGFRHPVSYTYNRKGKKSHKQVVFFIGETTTKKITLSHEHRGYYWLPYDAAFNKLSFENAQNLLKAAEEFLDR